MAKSNAARKVRAAVASGSITRSAMGEMPDYATFVSARAKTYWEELKRIENRRGVITAAIVAREAADPNSPLHDYPEWKWNDPQGAIEKYRENVARRLISVVRVYVTPDPEANRKPQRALVMVRDVHTRQPTLTNVFDALRSTVSRYELLRRETATLEGCRQRMKDYSELAGVIAGLDGVIEDSGVLLEDLEQQIEAEKKTSAAKVKKGKKKK